MAAVTVVGVMNWPSCWHPLFGRSQVTLDANGEKCGWVFQAPKTGTISTVGFRLLTVTTGPTVDIRVETVSTTDGFPTGTLWATNTNFSHNINNNDDDDWLEGSLTTGAVVTRGQLVAVVVVNDASGVFDIAQGTVCLSGSPKTFPYAVDFLGGVWAKRDSTASPNLLIGYSDGSTEPNGCVPTFQLFTVAYGSGTNPDERGNIFRIPVPVRVAGIWTGNEFGTGETCEIRLYEGSTLKESIAIDGDQTACTVDASLGGAAYHLFDTSVSLLADTDYRITVMATSAGASAVTMREFTVNQVSYLDAFDGGQNMRLTTRNNEGVWTQTSTRRACMGILIDQVEAGS